MIYLSKLVNGKIKDLSGEIVGKVEDILIKPLHTEYAPLEYVAVRPKKGGKIVYLPFEYVAGLTRSEITLKKSANRINLLPSLSDKFICLKKDIFDQQIVDLSGIRVVRVNDLGLGFFEERLCVLGIDVSSKGLLRRLGLDRLDFFNVMKVNFIDWRKAQPVHGQLKLDTVTQRLQMLHPADLANIVEDLNLNQGTRLVNSLDTKAAAQVMEEIDPELQKNMVKFLGPEKAGKIMRQMSPDELVDLIKTLPKSESKKFVEALDGTVARDIRKLMNYPDNTAGGLMSVEYVTVRPEMTVTEAVAEIKKVSERFNSLLYVYVTDKEGNFYGAVSLRRLLLASTPEIRIEDLLKTFPLSSTLRPDYTVEEIVNVMTKYNLFTVAVLDDYNKLIGVVLIDDIMRCLAPKA